MVQHQGYDNEKEGGTEEAVKLQVEDKHREYSGDQHGTGYEEQTGDVVAVFKDGRHDESTDCLGDDQ